jgi:glutathione peroxidase
MKWSNFILSLGCLFQIYGCNSRKIIVKTRPESLAPMGHSTFYTFKQNAIDEKTLIDFSSYKGKKIIVLNVASKCGYTDQYAEWEKYYQAHKEEVVVLGFPSNEFLGQEPGSNEEIAKFCSLTYGVTFPMFEKTTVRGKDKSALYTWLTDQTKNGWNTQEPTWNFCKYILDENGHLQAFLSSKITPIDESFLSIMNKK